MNLITACAPGEPLRVARFWTFTTSFQSERNASVPQPMTS